MKTNDLTGNTSAGDPTGHHVSIRQQQGGMEGIFWVAMLIMAGVIFLADQTGKLPRYGGANVWDWLMLGAGGLLLIQAFFQVLLPRAGRASVFWIIVGAVLFALGAGAIFGLDLTPWWPAILILIGLSSLARALRH